MEYLAPLQFIDLARHQQDPRRNLNLQQSPFSPPSTRTEFGANVISVLGSRRLAGTEPAMHPQFESTAYNPRSGTGPVSRPRSGSSSQGVHPRQASTRQTSVPTFTTHPSPLPGPITSSLYTHTNISGEFHYNHPRTTSKHGLTPSKSLRRGRKGSDSVQRTSFIRKTPVRPLIRSRMKLWNVTWLGGIPSSSIYRIHEERELEDDRPVQSQKGWSAEPFRPSDLRLYHVDNSQQDKFPLAPLDSRQTKASPRRSSPLDWPTDPIPPCPLSIIDEGSDSSESSSDEDLDAYEFEFDLSSARSIPTEPLNLDFDDADNLDVEGHGVTTNSAQISRPRILAQDTNKPTYNSYMNQSKRTKTQDMVIQRGSVNDREHEVDISSVYASIMRDRSLMRPDWM